MPTMLCRSCGKIIPLAPVECPQCGMGQDGAAAPSKPSPAWAYAVWALLFGAACGFAAGAYVGFSISRPKAATPPPVEFQPANTAPSAPTRLPSVTTYSIPFMKGTAELAPEADMILLRIRGRLRRNPFAPVVVTGYAGAGEADPKHLASARAFLVKSLLISGCGGRKESILAVDKVMPYDAPKADVVITSSHLGSAR